MLCKTLLVLSMLPAILFNRVAAQEVENPELVIPPIDAVRSPIAQPIIISEAAAAGPGKELSPGASSFIRGIALLLIPQEFEDENGWGNETRIQSGLNLGFDDGKFSTSRRWKQVNHGSWLRASGSLVEPETRFQLNAARLPDPGKGTQRYDVSVSARLRVTGQQQQWSYGVMLWSISAEAVADIRIRLTLDVKSQLVRHDMGTRLRFLPGVTRAEVQLTDYSLRRISHLKGKPVQEFGDWLEKLIRRRVARENNKLASRINMILEKKPDRLEIPFDIADWFGGATEMNEKMPR